jgi:hypothetical protein
MHINIRNTVQSTLVYMRLVVCTSGHLPLPTAVHWIQLQHDKMETNHMRTLFETTPMKFTNKYSFSAVVTRFCPSFFRLWWPGFVRLTRRDCWVLVCSVVDVSNVTCDVDTRSVNSPRGVHNGIWYVEFRTRNSCVATHEQRWIEMNPLS